MQGYCTNRTCDLGIQLNDLKNKDIGKGTLDTALKAPISQSFLCCNLQGAAQPHQCDMQKTVSTAICMLPYSGSVKMVDLEHSDTLVMVPKIKLNNSSINLNIPLSYIHERRVIRTNKIYIG